MTYLTKTHNAPADWPFGQLDPVQAHRHQRQAEALQRMAERQQRERAEAARRALLDRAGRALL